MIITIVGKRGKGKTTLAKQKIRESQAERIYIYDYLGEYISYSSENILVSRGDLKGFCRTAWNDSKKTLRLNHLVVFDEIDLYGKNNFQIEFLYRYGRHVNLDCIGIARRFYDLPVTARALTDTFYLFQITEERDINYLRRYISEEFIRRLIHLNDYEYINIDF